MIASYRGLENKTLFPPVPDEHPSSFNNWISITNAYQKGGVG